MTDIDRRTELKQLRDEALRLCDAARALGEAVVFYGRQLEDEEAEEMPRRPGSHRRGGHMHLSVVRGLVSGAAAAAVARALLTRKVLTVAAITATAVAVPLVAAPLVLLTTAPPSPGPVPEQAGPSASVPHTRKRPPQPAPVPAANVVPVAAGRPAPSASPAPDATPTSSRAPLVSVSVGPSPSPSPGSCTLRLPGVCVRLGAH